MITEGRQEQIPEIKDANGKVIKVGDTVRYSEWERDQWKNVMISIEYRGKVTSLNTDGTVSVINADNAKFNPKGKIYEGKSLIVW